MLSPGTFLNSRYEVVEKIGTGGMADVFRGKDHKLKRYVAIKVLKIEFSQDSSFVKKFQTEAEAAAGMMHPNVVNVYDVGVDSGYNYMVMELVNGITLKEYIQKKGRLSDKEVISIAIQMAAGLDAAHSKNLVHRDVKPQNVMISTEGKVKVTDFGIAKPTTSDTVNANAMGSVHYTSPEQARGGSCDVQSDIYSTGITIYEMITGVIPFDGESTVAIALKHIQEDMVLASEYVPDIFYSLERIILKCTQKSPSRRYDSMKALIIDLKRSLIDPDGDFVDIGPAMYNLEPKTYKEDEDDYDEDDYDEDDFEDEDDDEDDEKIRKVTKILTIVVAVIVAITVIFIAGRAIGFFRFGSGEEATAEVITMPNLEGMTEEDAENTLAELGLGYDVRGYEESATYEEGLIIAQSLEMGSEVEVNSTVRVTVSSGLASVIVEVPDVLGESETTAQKLLNVAGLKMESESEYSDTVESGKIISMSPEAGSEAAEDSTVIVVVSMGIEKISVPSVTGLGSAQAKLLLSEAGFESKEEEDYSSTVAVGNVISQSISGGVKAEKGSVITYTISKGEEIKNVTMPNVIGMSSETAATLLESEQYGFEVTINEINSSTVAFDYIISSNISAGASIPVGTKITLFVSIGPEVTQPDVETNTNTDSSTDVEAETETQTE